MVFKNGLFIKKKKIKKFISHFTLLSYSKTKASSKTLNVYLF